MKGLVGLIKSRSSFSVRKIETASMLFIVLTTWIVTIRNPSILGMIETMGAPMIAAILFILPVVAMRIVPAMKKIQHISSCTSVHFNLWFSFNHISYLWCVSIIDASE